MKITKTTPKPPPTKEELPIEELKQFLKGKFIILDCGHRFTTHQWSNTLILTSEGKTFCHNCY